MLLTRYGNIEYVLKLKLKQAIKLVKKAIEEDNKEKLFQLYLVDHKHDLYLFANGAIKQKDLKTFNEYIKDTQMNKYSYDTRSTDEIMAELLKPK